MLIFALSMIFLSGAITGGMLVWYWVKLSIRSVLWKGVK
jgi:hypothetical protein